MLYLLLFILHQTIVLDKAFGPFLVFMDVVISIIAFHVLAQNLVERRLLITIVEQLVMSAAAVNDIVAWVLLALAIALLGSGKSLAIIA